MVGDGERIDKGNKGGYIIQEIRLECEKRIYLRQCLRRSNKENEFKGILGEEILGMGEMRGSSRGLYWDFWVGGDVFRMGDIRRYIGERRWVWDWVY